MAISTKGAKRQLQRNEGLHHVEQLETAFDYLPVELIVEIISWLPIASILSFRSTAQHIAKLVDFHVPTVKEGRKTFQAKENGPKYKPIEETEFSTVTSIALTPKGHVAFVEYGESLIHILNLKTGKLYRRKIIELFRRPYGILAMDNGDLIVSDSSTHTVSRVEMSGGKRRKHTVIAGQHMNTGFVNGDKGKLNVPRGLCMDSNGRILVCDTSNRAIRQIKEDGSFSTLCGSPTSSGIATDGPVATASFFSPRKVVVDSKRDIIYVADGTAIRRISSGYVDTIYNQDNPIHSMALDKRGDLYFGTSEGLKKIYLNTNFQHVINLSIVPKVTHISAAFCYEETLLVFANITGCMGYTLLSISLL